MADSPIALLHKLVFSLNKGADQLLQTHFGISYRRALFLAALHDGGVMTQHALAQALGYSDSAASAMLATLQQQGYVVIQTSPQHKRKRIVALTEKGSTLIIEAKRLLDAQFASVLKAAHVDSELYNQLTENIYQVVINNKEEQK